jgi:putative transposase
MARPSRFSPEVRDRAVRVVLEQQDRHDSQWAAITSIAEKLGGTAETLRSWLRQAERDAGRRPGLTTEERARLKQLERDPAEGVGVFRPGGARAPSQMMLAFIDAHREAYGVEPICAVLPIAPSLYYELKAREREPARRPERTRRDAVMSEYVGRVWRENREVYGVRKVWKQLLHDGHAVARDGGAADAPARAPRRGAVRKCTVTTIPDTAAPRPADLGTRQLRRRGPTSCGWRT